MPGCLAGLGPGKMTDFPVMARVRIFYRAYFWPATYMRGHGISWRAMRWMIERMRGPKPAPCLAEGEGDRPGQGHGQCELVAHRPQPVLVHRGVTAVNRRGGIKKREKIERGKILKRGNVLCKIYEWKPQAKKGVFLTQGRCNRGTKQNKKLEWKLQLACIHQNWWMMHPVWSDYADQECKWLIL